MKLSEVPLKACFPLLGRQITAIVVLEANKLDIVIN